MVCYLGMVGSFDGDHLFRYGFVCFLHNSFRNVFDILVNVVSLLNFLMNVAFRKLKSVFIKVFLFIHVVPNPSLK